MGFSTSTTSGAWNCSEEGFSDPMHVLHFRNGTTSQLDAPPNIDPQRQVVSTGSEPSTEVPFADLKAVFFLNDDRGTTEREVAPREGSFLAVEFFDDEVIRGFARYNPASPGFFLYPAEEGRIERVFVVAAAVQSIEIEKV
jgi:hypothetical protein